jgi:hypothetical protein
MFLSNYVPNGTKQYVNINLTLFLNYFLPCEGRKQWVNTKFHGIPLDIGQLPISKCQETVVKMHLIV